MNVFDSSVCTNGNTLQGLLKADVLNINTENWSNQETRDIKIHKKERMARSQEESYMATYRNPSQKISVRIKVIARYH